MQAGVQGTLERASLGNFVLRWVRYVRGLAMGFLYKQIEQKHEHKRALELKLVKMRMDVEKLRSKADQASHALTRGGRGADLAARRAAQGQLLGSDQDAPHEQLQ
jgi:hypothetical protein